jgi:SAM-dependent methyltransferase
MDTFRAAYFDAWYADMEVLPAKDAIMQRHLGIPPRLLSTSLLTADGVDEVVERLGLGPGSTLLDLACGRGGYGLEIARRTGCRLVGVDFSAVALGVGRETQGDVDATWVVGDLAATTLPDGSVDAVLCVDAVQFADDQQRAYDEMLRVLAPGGRLALTCWEAVQRGHPAVPERLLRVDVTAGLTAAGFVEVEVQERPGWRAAERSMWQEAAALDPGDDPAMRSFHDEAVRSLASFDALRRVLGTATAP